MLHVHAWLRALWAVADTQDTLAEEAAAERSRVKWTEWLHDGPGKGLGRQHRMSRTATGWIPSPTAAVDDDYGDDDPEAELVAEACGQAPVAAVPLHAQQAADAQGIAWGCEWAVGAEYPLDHWPLDMGPPLPPIDLQLFRWALASFPVGTGLGWDAVHPRALLRLPDDVLADIIALLALCEQHGVWPEAR